MTTLRKLWCRIVGHRWKRRQEFAYTNVRACGNTIRRRLFIVDSYVCDRCGVRGG